MPRCYAACLENPSMELGSSRAARKEKAILAVMAGFAACVAVALRIAWHPPVGTYVEYVPIGAVFAGLVWDRLFPRHARGLPAALCDAAIVALAAMRVIAPPLPFVSGHTLLAAYATVTARHRTLRVVALVVLAHVMLDKLVLSGGVTSMLTALVVALGLAGLSRSFEDPERGGVELPPQRVG
jgi:hypothetical protein